MIGRMRHRVTIQSQSTAQDGHGQPVDTWTDVQSVWASIRPISSKEYYAASGERGEITHEIKIRFGATVSSEDRIVYGTRVFDIMPPFDVDERNRFLVVRAIERGV